MSTHDDRDFANIIAGYNTYPTRRQLANMPRQERLSGPGRVVKTVPIPAETISLPEPSRRSSRLQVAVASALGLASIMLGTAYCSAQDSLAHAEREAHTPYVPPSETHTPGREMAARLQGMMLPDVLGRTATCDVELDAQAALAEAVPGSRTASNWQPIQLHQAAAIARTYSVDCIVPTDGNPQSTTTATVQGQTLTFTGHDYTKFDFADICDDALRATAVIYPHASPDDLPAYRAEDRIRRELIDKYALCPGIALPPTQSPAR
jgi:hypothetical protein